MKQQGTATGLTPANRIYLYRLLRDALGPGKQTFSTAVEEALAADGLGARELGYATLRELLEDLDDFIKLTVFKGGRLYATVIANPTWDEALDAPAEERKGAAKSWKRRSKAKACRPQRPRPIPQEPEPTAEQPSEPSEPPARPKPETAASEVDPDGPGIRSGAPEPERDAAPEDRAKSPAPVGNDAPVETPLESSENETAPAEEAPSDGAGASEPAPAVEPGIAPDEPQAQPAFSLTVTFDPEHADAGVTTLESTPVAPQPPAADADPEPTVAARNDADATDARRTADGQQTPAPDRSASATSNAASDPAPEPAPAPAAVDLSGYPVDFTQEVFCPGDTLSELARLLPFGADALGIAGEYFHIACLNGSAELARNRASFPMGYLADGERRQVLVTIRKRPAAGKPATGLCWSIERIEPIAPDA